MADRRDEPDAKSVPTDDPVPSTQEGSEAVPQMGPDRREFLRQMPGDAARTAGRLAGFSSIIRRSVLAASGVAIRDLEAASDDGPIPPVGIPPDASPNQPTDPPGAAPRVPEPVIHDPVASLTAEQHEFLAMGGHAVMAANDPGGAPHLTSSIFDWDGKRFRLPGRLSSARAIDIDRDPRVSLLIEDRTTEAWVAVTGIASLAPIDTVEAEMMQLLTRSFGEDGASRRWHEVRSTGDPIVIHIRPTRFLWRPA